MSEIDFSGLEYQRATGLFFRAKRPGRAITTTSKDGYIVIRVGKKLHYGHRLAWQIVYGVKPDGVIDHINGTKTDNRIENLRLVDHRINSHNKKSANCRNKSCGLLGVTKPKQTKKWCAAITIDRRRIHLGYFSTPEEAHAAYVAAKVIYHPSAPHLSVF